jgi:hypothetical protein
MVWRLRQTIDFRTCPKERSYIMDRAGGWFEISWSICNRLEAAESPSGGTLLSRSKTDTGSVKDLANRPPVYCSFSRARRPVVGFTNRHLSGAGGVRQNYLGLLLADSWMF